MPFYPFDKSTLKSKTKRAFFRGFVVSLITYYIACRLLNCDWISFVSGYVVGSGVVCSMIKGMLK